MKQIVVEDDFFKVPEAFFIIAERLYISTTSVNGAEVEFKSKDGKQTRKQRIIKYEAYINQPRPAYSARQRPRTSFTTMDGR